MYVVAWLGIRKVHHAHVNEGAFESREFVCQSLLMSRASVHELPLAVYTKVLRDEGFEQTHRCNRQPAPFSRASRADLWTSGISPVVLQYVRRQEGRSRAARSWQR